MKPIPHCGPRRARPPVARTAAAIIATAVLASLAASCGGSPSSTSPGGSSTAGGSTTSQLVAFSRCVRSHGVPNFPDPQPSAKFPSAQQLGVSSSQYQAAENACQRLLPNSGNGVTQVELQQILGAMREFTQCMHSHGVPNWPEPTPDPEGGGRFIFNPQAVGIDPDSPRISTRMRDCDRVFPASMGVPPGAGHNPP